MADELAPYVIKRLDGLKRSEDIGVGASGVVREVKVNGLPCIAKRLHDILTNEQRGVSQLERKSISERFRYECILLSRLRHPNIVQFLGVHYGRDRYDLTLVMERMHMDLETALEKFPNISLPTKLKILLDASYGLMHLHCQTPPIVHRDFTAANILLSPDMRAAKVADLGVSKILDMSPHQLFKLTKCPGALGYMPPEALQQKPVYDVKLDVFSFGHLALYTVNQQFPEVYELGPEGYEALRSGTAQLAKRTIAVDMMGKDHCLHQVVTTCLQDSSEKRPTIAQVNSALQDLATQPPVNDSHATDSHCECNSCQQQLSAEKDHFREFKKTTENEIEQLRDQISALTTKLEDSSEALQRKAAECVKLRGVLHHTPPLNVRALETERAEFKQLADENRVRAQESESKVVELEHQLREARESERQLKEKLEREEAHSANLLAVKSEEDRQVEGTSRRIAELTAENEDFHRQVQIKESQVEQLRLSGKAPEDESEIGHLKQRVLELEKQEEQLVQSCEAAVKELSARNEERKQFQVQLQFMTTELERLRNEYQHNSTTASEELARSQMILEQANFEFQQFQDKSDEKIHGKNEQLQKQQAMLEARKCEIQGLQQELARVKKENGRLQHNVDQLKDHLERMKATSKNEGSARICPICETKFPARMSQHEFERHVQSHFEP